MLGILDHWIQQQRQVHLTWLESDKSKPLDGTEDRPEIPQFMTTFCESDNRV